MRDEGEAYAARLRRAGVPTDLERHGNQMHGFFTLLMLPGSELGFQQVVRAVRACIVRAQKVRTCKAMIPRIPPTDIATGERDDC